MNGGSVSYELSDLYGDLDEDPTQPALAPPFGPPPFFNDEAPTRELPLDVVAGLRMVSAELPGEDD